MFSYLYLRSTAIWFLLVFATGLSWWLGHDAAAAYTQGVATTGMILIAAIKIRLVVRHFMEVRYAPMALQLILDTWLLLMTICILAAYWFQA